MSQVILETQNLKKYFKTRAGFLHAVDDVNLSIPRGSTLGVVGESGCGKSTLGRVILRSLEPTGGKVLFEGEDILTFNKQQMARIRQEIQMIFQDPYSSLNPRMTVSEIIAEPIKVCKLASSGAELNQKVTKLMDQVGLSARLWNTYPHELDGGRRQRVGVARALAVSPKFIVCDEPVSALDVSIQAQILNLLMDLQDELDLTYLFITHDLSVVKHISAEIAVMYLGQCVERAPSEQLFERPLHPYTQALLAAIPIPGPEGRSRKRQIIKGEVTSPVNPKPGCRFAPRCPKATAACVQENIPLEQVLPGHFVACTLCGVTEKEAKV